jgi:hypothetical protein
VIEPRSRWMAIAMMLASGVAAMACGPPGGPAPDTKLAAPLPRDPHFDAACEPRHYCTRLDLEDHSERFDAEIALIDCTVQRSASLSGSWAIDTPKVVFDWQAEVRVDAVFPTRGQVVAYLGCAQARPLVHSPVARIARNPDDLGWAEVEDSNVFIPFSGKATIDDAFVATAALEATDGGGGPRVTVSIEGPPPTPPARHADLGRGDGFPWGDRRATVARIIPPQDGELGVIGWVEIELSGRP